MSELIKSIVYMKNICEACKTGDDVWTDVVVIDLVSACVLCADAAMNRVSTFIIQENNEYICSECGKVVSSYIYYNGGQPCITYCEHCGKALNWADVRRV